MHEIYFHVNNCIKIMETMFFMYTILFFMPIHCSFARRRSTHRNSHSLFSCSCARRCETDDRPTVCTCFFRVFDRRCRPIALFAAYSRTVVLADALGLYITKTHTLCVCVCVCVSGGGKRIWVDVGVCVFHSVRM